MKEIFVAVLLGAGIGGIILTAFGFVFELKIGWNRARVRDDIGPEN